MSHDPATQLLLTDTSGSPDRLTACEAWVDEARPRQAAGDGRAGTDASTAHPAEREGGWLPQSGITSPACERRRGAHTRLHLRLGCGPMEGGRRTRQAERAAASVAMSPVAGRAGVHGQSAGGTLPDNTGLLKDRATGCAMLLAGSLRKGMAAG